MCGHKLLADKCLFWTEHYSIENYLVCEETLVIIWTELMRLPRQDGRLNGILTAFEVASASFNDAMTPVMAWIIWLKRQGHKVNLNDVSMDNILATDRDCISTLVPGWAEHILAASNTHGVVYREECVAGVCKELLGKRPKTYVRGKCELWWFIKFLNNCVLPKGRQRVSANDPIGTCSVNISTKTAIDTFAPRLLPPPILTAFLEQALTGSLHEVSIGPGRVTVFGTCNR